MKKIFLAGLFTLVSLKTMGQVTEKAVLDKTAAVAEKKIDITNLGWKKFGNIVFLFNQSAFNNDWLGGGTSNIAGSFKLNYDFNYASRSQIFDNKLIIGYGLTQQKGKDLTKADDRIEYTSLFGQKLGQTNWYLSVFTNIKTQMDSGFDGLGKKNSHFLSPFYWQFGPGLLWKKSNNLKLNLAPITTRLILVDKDFTTIAPAFGVEIGKSSRLELGAALNAYYKLDLMENVSVENILNMYSNYQDKPKNVDVDYQMNMVMKVNKYISTNLAFQMIVDDNASSHAQIREVFGIGFNYTF